jgi:alkylation response protein AidB-like acyl-CoA dehydrogenase
MNIILNESQRILKNSTREFLDKECPKEFVRSMEEDKNGYTQELWEKLANIGWLGYVLPEESGGLGGDVFELGLIVEEIGYAAMPGPFFSTAILGADLVQSIGSPTQKAEILPQLAKGELFLTTAFMEPQGGMSPQDTQTAAIRDGDRYLITGTKLFVSDAHIANYIICVVKTHAETNSDDAISLLLVPKDTANVELVPLVTTAGDKMFEVSFNSAAVPTDNVLGDINKAWPILDIALQKATALKTLEMVGGMQAALDLTLEYAKHRVAFGRPIGSFQAVHHHLADMYRETETSRLLAYEAVWRLSQDLPASREVSLAKSRVNQAAGFVTRMAHQIYGGVGYYVEAPLEIYTRRFIAGQSSFGDTKFHLDRVATQLRPLGR